MSEEFDKALATKLVLRRAGVVLRSEHDEFGKVLNNFIECGELPKFYKLHPQEFMFALYKIWAQLGVSKRDRKNRSIRGIDSTFRTLGILSSYHRLSGRLALKQGQARVFLNVFFSSWVDGVPHPAFTEEKIQSLEQMLFSRPGLSTRSRINAEGLNEGDLEYLLELYRGGIRLHIDEICSLLEAKAEVEKLLS